MRRDLVSCGGVLLLALCALTPGVAQAEQPASTVERLEPKLHRNEFMVTAHARAAFVPKLLLDLWFEEHARSWSEGERNLAYGADLVWRLRGDYELGVSFDYADLSLPSQFWRQKGESLDDADFTTMDVQLLSVVFTTHWYWDPIEWLSPYLGVGIGVGYLAGDGIVQYKPVSGSSCERELGQGEEFTPRACYGADGEPDPTQIDQSTRRPAERVPVVPVLHAAGGLRFNIYRYGVIKLEVGVNDYTYVGLSAGGQWW